MRARWRNALLTGAVAAALVLLVHVQDASLHHSSLTSGWLLLAMVFWLASYNLRKKLPFLPLGSSSGWLQLHIHIGLISMLAFGLHALYRPGEGLHLPNGVLEATLAALYTGVALSGVFGLFLSRAIPRRLAVRGEEVIFERIPAFQRRIADEVRELALRSVRDANATTLADFYELRLAHFFAAPRHFWLHLLQSSRPRHALLTTVGDLDRYLSDPEREIADQLCERIRRKDDLDYHHALQAVLKTWLFLHIGLTYALLVVAVAHALLAHAFLGGAT